MSSRIRIKAVESTYTAPQVAQYLAHIRFPGFSLDAELDSDSEQQCNLKPGNMPLLACTLENLERLVQRHLVTFPFENTAMHYTEKHEMDISPEGLFERLVLAKKGYGSYCFGQNELLLGMLRGLGYRTYAGPARVNQTPPNANSISDTVEFTSQSHMVLFVQLPDLDSNSDADVRVSSTRDRDTYLVDVGFGGLGLVRPILLRAGSTVRGAAPPEEHRLTRARHLHSSLSPPPHRDGERADSDSDAKDPSLEWRLEVRCGEYVPAWHTIYQFALHETFPTDRDAMNFAVSQREGHGPFFANIMAISHFFLRVRVDMDTDFDSSDVGCDSGDMGRMVLFGKRVDRRVGDRSERVAEVKTDAERIAALRTFFGIDIPEASERYIHGRLPQIV